MKVPVLKAVRSMAPVLKALRSKVPVLKAPRLKAPVLKEPRSTAPVLKALRSKAPVLQALRSKAPVLKAHQEKAPNLKMPRSKASVRSPPLLSLHFVLDHSQEAPVLFLPPPHLARFSFHFHHFPLMQFPVPWKVPCMFPPQWMYHLLVDSPHQA